MSQWTIAAIATPPGQGGVGIVRVSGEKSLAIAQQILGFAPRPRHAHYAAFYDHDGSLLEKGIALYFPHPHSFTGEDVLELQAHGGPILLNQLLQRCFALGAQPARPGEFSERAFVNDKLDLVQAEAIADLIAAGTQKAAQSALRSLQGDFSREVNALVDDLTQLRLFVEAALDFPDEEDVDFLTDGQVGAKLENLMASLTQLLGKAKQGALLREGLSVVILGQPNAGKSSLLNALSRKDAAIVTEIAGTTRDILREDIQIDGLPLHLVDTAGIRQANDLVERLGVDRAWQAAAAAHLVLLLVDGTQGWTPEDAAILAMAPKDVPLILVWNKADQFEQIVTRPGDVERQISISAKAGLGLDELKALIKSVIGYSDASEGVFMARERHIHALGLGLSHLEAAHKQLEFAPELMAEDLRLCQMALGEITGQVTSDDLLGKIFSSFCIGK